MKKNILIGCLVILCFTIGIISGYFFLKKEENTSIKNTVENNNPSMKSEFNTSVEEQYADILDQYFNFDYLYLYNYENIARYPTAYKDVVLSLDVDVVKVIEEENNHYKMLVNMADHDYEEQEFVIEGDYKKARYLENDFIKVYGVYKGNEKYVIDGKDKVLPKINAIKVIVSDATGEFNEYDEEDIREIATHFFNSSYTLTKPNYDFTGTLGMYYASLPFHYLITLDNNSNARFNKYRIYTGYGRIDVATEEDSPYLQRYISKTSDGNHFILSTYTTNNDYLELQAYDKDFKQIWTRTFEQAGKYIYDNNGGRIVIVIDNDLYIIDENTGENIIDPIIVSKYNTIKLLANGDIILVTQSAKDFIFYITKDGNIKWKSSLSTYNGEASNTVDSIYALLVANDTIYVGFKTSKYNANVVLFNQNGEEIVNTFANPNN